jgi:hypothetical protein
LVPVQEDDLVAAPDDCAALSLAVDLAGISSIDNDG